MTDRTLENQIIPYTDVSFDAKVQAKHFFALYGEADITKKLNEMSSIQQAIETLLRQKVRANYGMFLLANKEITHVDEEMSDLKSLIQNTQKLIDDVQQNRITESRAMHRNSFLVGVGETLEAETGRVNDTDLLERETPSHPPLTPKPAISPLHLSPPLEGLVGACLACCRRGGAHFVD
mmetsp:Transcript_27058/g.61257  ORF Transcript_27058/g.61257 Transcript_27058/m.61257 type:complete len:179 (+) Transcript_27058:133-669(+)